MRYIVESVLIVKYNFDGGQYKLTAYFPADKSEVYEDG